MPDTHAETPGAPAPVAAAVSAMAIPEPLVTDAGPTVAGLSEHDFVIALGAGDTRVAAAHLLRTHGAAVHGYLHAILHDASLVTDAYTLVAEWSWAGLARARGASTPRAWLFGLAACAARRVSADSWPRVRQGLERGAATSLALEHAALPVARRDLVEEASLERLHEHLTPAERNLLALRLEQHLEWQEVADVLSAEGPRVSATAARKRFERMKERIALLAREQGIVG